MAVDSGLNDQLTCPVGSNMTGSGNNPQNKPIAQIVETSNFNSTHPNTTQLNQPQLNQTLLNPTQLNPTLCNSTQINSTQLNLS